MSFKEEAKSMIIIWIPLIAIVSFINWMTITKTVDQKFEDEIHTQEELVTEVIGYSDHGHAIYAEDLFEPEIEFIDVDPQDRRCLALNIYYEARGDNLAGKYAVADVVINRSEDRRYPAGICEVIYEAKVRADGTPKRDQCQFSWYCDGRSDTPQDDVAWTEAQQIAQQILDYPSKFRGITEGATHYHAFQVHPDWINDRGMHRIGRIGDHIFYRWA
jgi:spore germination cell wall hydrolase CwlJ-like protein